uniref:Hint domain-containing protein n=1 Tax=viral metagenome TaxID=1070528 RepID=A0A6C0LJ24_9ZZZZ
MPSGKNWFYFLYVNLAFLAYIGGIFYFSQLQDIKDNWNTYRCNPIYMPMADDVESNFTYCVQNSMSGFMGYILEPITFITTAMGSMVSGISNEVNMVRAMFNKIRTFFSTMIQSVFGIFMNLIIEFQKIIISMKDLMGKTIGILVTFMYLMDGSLKTMQSMWNGPSGKLVRALGCFPPDTELKLKTGATISIKDLNLGDVLENGSIVDKIIKLDNIRNPNQMYKIVDESNNTIYVTGSHYVYDKKTDKFVKVSDYNKAVKTDKQEDWLCNLCTSDNKIKIGDEIFWDWDDDCFNENLH